MSDAPARDRDDERKLVFEYDLDAPPEKVWRAVTIPALRARWLPQTDLAESEPVSSVAARRFVIGSATPSHHFSKAA